MKIFNNKLITTIIFICVFIFAFYNIITPVYNTSINIEGFDNISDTMYTGNASSTSPFTNKYDSSKMPKFSSIFDNKCLLGCVSPTSAAQVDNSKCKQNVRMPNSNKMYKKCPWRCVPDILDKHPELKSVYAEYLEKGYPICEKEREEKHCSGCHPDAYF